MSPLAQMLVDAVVNAGGSTTYPQLLTAISPEFHPQIPRAKKEAKKLGFLSEQVDFDPETGVNTHRVFIPVPA